MPKKLSESQKNEISKSFINGLAIKRISEIYNFSSQTIIKLLKNILGDENYKIIKEENIRKYKQKTYDSLKEKSLEKNKKSIKKNHNLNSDEPSKLEFDDKQNKGPFFEIIPLTDGVELNDQKDITSIPINDIDLPETVYMLVDKSIELEPKILKDYPDWEFLPEDDLERMTLEIYSDQKYAKKICSKNQKLIKVPNPKVFLIASSFLKAKGISRIIYKDALLSL